LALQLYPTKYQYNRKDDVRIFTFNSKKHAWNYFQTYTNRIGST